MRKFQAEFRVYICASVLRSIRICSTLPQYITVYERDDVSFKFNFQLNEVNAELDSLDDTVTEEVSKDDTGLDSIKDSTLLNRTTVSYIKIIHYQEPADEVVETTGE
jgi:hypothetical protein